MGRDSEIEYCDSTCNPMMGCDGCELWAPEHGIQACYAGRLVDGMKRAGQPGYPKTFGEPALFPHRLRQACDWKDLTGTSRVGKPWLDGLPRVIFLDDMGDTWTESLDTMWLRPHVESMAAAPHIWLFLTKRPRRMAAFFEALGYVPRNFWLGVSVIERRSFMSRLEAMERIRHRFPQALLWVSWEPAYEPLPWNPSRMSLFNWFVFGGESGPDARPSHPFWFRDAAQLAGDLWAARFFKQWGEWIPVSEISDTRSLYYPRQTEAPKRCRYEETVLQLDGRQAQEWPSGAMQMFKLGKRKTGAALNGAEIHEMPRRAA